MENIVLEISPFWYGYAVGIVSGWVSLFVIAGAFVRSKREAKESD